MTQIMDFQVGDNMEVVVLIKQAEVRLAKNGKRFIAFVFQDTSGEVAGKFWDAHDDTIQTFTAGALVHLEAQRELYNGQPQVKIQKMRLVDPDEGFSVTQFISHAPTSAEKMREAINQALFEITNAKWNRIVRYLLQKFQHDFYEAPAAKTNHHNFAGGLAFHTTSMLTLGKQLCEDYPQIDRSLLLAGIILHDLGKVKEMSGPVATEYTVAGNLIGHIVLVDEEIIQAALALKIDPSDEAVLLLRHMILAHHGLLEYGSPKRPALLEAEILHHIDELDASIAMMTRALQHTDPGHFSDRIFGLDNRRFYRPNVTDPN